MQMVNHACCQVCGRTIPMAEAEADGWLVAPYKKIPGYNVVRCYRHWSEWALRNSAGRTKGNRQKMMEGRERAANDGPTIHPAYEPFPTEDKL